MDVGQFDGCDFLRRRNAAEYLLKKYGFGAEKTLAKGAVTGDSPEYHKAGRLVLYTRCGFNKGLVAHSKLVDGMGGGDD